MCDHGDDFNHVDDNFLNFTTQDDNVAVLLHGDSHPTFASVMKIVLPPFVVIGLVGLLSLIRAAVKPRVFCQYPVCIYLIGISVCGILQLLQYGYEWISLLLKRYPLSNVFCKVWVEMLDPVSR